VVGWCTKTSDIQNSRGKPGYGAGKVQQLVGEGDGSSGSLFGKALREPQGALQIPRLRSG
jgi:hypothetical protein